MTNNNTAYLLIGGNQGHRETYLLNARNGIEETCGRIVKASAIYQTAAWGLEDQAAFLNQALKIKTSLTAKDLLRTILGLEESLGRKRELKYGPRTIDIDVLFFNNEVIDTEGLTVPHPQMQNRRFVLVPLAEIAAQKIHPLLHKTVLEMVDDCRDTLAVQKFQ